MTQRFDFDFSRDVQRWNRFFAVNPRTAYILVDDGDLIAHFGPWTLATTLNNIVDATITGPYRLWRVAGPARLSLADRGLTFATTTRTGLCVTFRSPVPGIDPLGIVQHPNLTVTVRDPRGLAKALGFTEGSTTRAAKSEDEVEQISPELTLERLWPDGLTDAQYNALPAARIDDTTPTGIRSLVLDDRHRRPL